MRKKTTPPSRGRPQSEMPTRAAGVHIRATKQWREWLSRFAEHEQLAASDLINQALMAYAKTKGFEPPPKR